MSTAGSVQMSVRPATTTAVITDTVAASVITASAAVVEPARAVLTTVAITAADITAMAAAMTATATIAAAIARAAAEAVHSTKRQNPTKRTWQPVHMRTTLTATTAAQTSDIRASMKPVEKMRSPHSTDEEKYATPGMCITESGDHVSSRAA